ncbi:EAL domain-containing protein [Tumebacillus permanentifrigoris]|uniref:EAL domain-containing protein (Putative c-di-GMP-specific phosphodiesterase class I) n=1 Tax=Tumebacillus permanentifrigoris TaxID=378543 RepID=A0A316D2A6_9BACL|nr:EAL domain-containing protein [Tumebacillus permanentifrigoris]PWK04991.1 EAL domain-containing protein (putative c-di-GMP-specific phosphodiesterase class I) [Tumebacillus permanentifrigoris]
MTNQPCQACTQTRDTGYAVQFAGAQNAVALQAWKNGDKFTPYRELNESTIWVPEHSFAGLIDYFQAHMDTDQLQAAPLTADETVIDSPWQSLDQIQRHHSAHWIDDVIADSRIKTVFQPIVSVQAGMATVQGFEFLSRAIEQDGSLIPPYKMFEAARLRDRLFALDRVCRISAVRNANLVGDKLVFVNFIPTAIYAPEHCLQTTFEEAQKSGVDPRNFVFEVVETDQVDNVNHLENILHYYRKHGFRYALDDVGQGYSTLEMVERLKPDFVKLDMHYVQGVTTDVTKQKAALDLLHTARAVGSRPLAEGVETLEDWRWLVEAGYELFQGYLFGKPEATARQVVDVSLT